MRPDPGLALSAARRRAPLPFSKIAEIPRNDDPCVRTGRVVRMRIKDDAHGALWLGRAGPWPVYDSRQGPVARVPLAAASGHPDRG